MIKKHFLLFFILSSTFAFPYTIEDKKRELSANKDQEAYSEQDQHTLLKNLNATLQEEYQKAAKRLESSSSREDFQDAHKKIATLKEEIKDLETTWKIAQREDVNKDGEISGFWELGETSISKLIIEYGSSDALYVIPPDIASQKLTMHCLLSIPKESWPKMIDLILTQNNIGVKESGPFVKHLFHLKDDFMNVDAITSDRDYLSLLEPTKRAIFIYSPPMESIKPTFYFFEKFKNSKTTFIYQVGPKIAIAGLVKDVSKLLSLADNVWEQSNQRISKIITPNKITPEDAVKLLKSYFGGLTDYSRPTISMKGGNGLSAFALKNENSLVIIGSKQNVDKAETILKETEAQVNDPTDLTLYWHTCNHCKPIELSETLSKVYRSLISCSVEKSSKTSLTKNRSYPTHGHPAYGGQLPPTYTQDKVQNNKQKKGTEKAENFFPFPATGSLLMVVRKDTLGKIKEVIKKLDTPKKMVEIEVLLCERRVDNSSKSGINLLKLAGGASGTDSQSFSFNDPNNKTSGLMEFLFSKVADTKNSIPAIDLGYNFLLSQEDIMVTASPSTTTLNQVPTTLAITDQISINSGANGKNVSSYQREDFGITITLTPTIHDKDPDDPLGSAYITLENDIRFDTITSQDNERPSVHKRHITNTVRIPDGETVIIGGLRSTTTEESNQKIPFLGEIPGFAKIFGSTTTSQKNSEMFIFIKPRLIEDPATDLLRIREERLRRRPGDTEALLSRINESKRFNEKMRFEKSVNLLFGSGNKHDYRL